MYYIMKGRLYAAKAGRKNSYTPSKEHAACYPTIEAARRNCCGNESIMKG